MVEKPQFSWFWLLERLQSACGFQTFLAPVTSAVALSSVLYSGFCASAPHFLISSLCAPWGAGTQPALLAAPGLCIALARGSRGPGRTSAGPVIAASTPRSAGQRRKRVEFWYRCCSWCCESGRRAAHPLTRLFHDTRVASYPSSPGEPRGTRADVDLGVGWGRTGCV